MESELPLKDLVEKVVAKSLEAKGSLKNQIFQFWEEIVPPAIHGKTEPYRYQDKSLYIRVIDPVWAFDINLRYKLSLLKRLQHEFGESQIQEIRLKVGSVKRL